MLVAVAVPPPASWTLTVTVNFPLPLYTWFPWIVRGFFFPLTVPEVRARALDEFARTIDQIAAAVANRTGRSPDDFAVRTMAGAVIGVVMSATTPWARHPSTDVFERIDAALAHLEAGLPL